MSLADPLRWLREGCDLDADVLPAVRIAAARASPGYVKSWAYFTDAVADARNKRLSPMPAATYIHRGQDHGKTRLAQAVDRLRADVRAASSGDRG